MSGEAAIGGLGSTMSFTDGITPLPRRSVIQRARRVVPQPFVAAWAAAARAPVEKGRGLENG
jgi:hypothetical protein